MKFQRTDLIKRVEAEIGRRILAAQEANTKAQAKAEKDRREYLDRTTTAWTAFAENITAAVKAGRPVTTDDCPTGLKDGWMDRVPLRRPDSFTPAPDREPDTAALDTLLDLLKAATDDEVTTSSLERMGFRTAQLFRR